MRVHGGGGGHEDKLLLHHRLHGAGGGGLPHPAGASGQVLTAGPADGLTVFSNVTYFCDILFLRL